MPEPPKPKGDADASAAKGAPPAGLGFGATKKAAPLDEAAAAATKGAFAASAPVAPPPAGSKAPPQPGDAHDPIDALFRMSAPPVTVPRRLQAHHQVSVDVEPVAALFGSEVIVPAPSLPPEPSEAELGRMQATGRTSVFGDLVRDPPPPPEVAVPRAPRVPSIVPEADAEAPLPPAPSAPKTAAPPPVPADAGEKRKARKKQAAPTAEKAAAEVPAQAEAQPAAPVSAEASPAARIGAAVVGVIALSISLCVVLGVLPNPFAAAPAPAAAPPRAPAPAPAPTAPPVPTPTQPIAQKPAASAPVASTPPAAEEAAPRAAVPAAPEPKAAEPAAAAPKAHAPEPVATAPKPPAEPVRPAAAKPAVAAAPAEPAAPKPAAETDQANANTAALVIAARKKLADDEPKAAETLLRQALDIDPQDHHVMELLAHALMDQERGKEALVYARKIVQRRPRRAPYRLLLGDLLLMVGDEAGAKAEWQKALALSPDDVQIKRRLGM